MFDYKKFEDDVVIAMENALKGWMEEYDDIYIFALDCPMYMDSIGIIANTKEYLSEQADEPEDYWYYKYCVGEWELYDVMKEVSACMCKYLEDNEEQFTNPETYVYQDAFYEHRDKIIEASKNALKRLRRSVNKYFPDLLLLFSMADYLSNEECIEIFASVNSKEALEEYAEHIDDFN